MNAERDRAFGRFFGKHGLRISRSEIEPTPSDRYSSWASQYFRLPPDKRNPPTRITLPETTMNATVIGIFSRLSAEQKPSIRSVIRSQLAGFPEHKIIAAESRVRQSIRRGVDEREAIRRAVAVARCATDPSEPTPPDAA